MDVLADKRIVLGVCGGIAAYRSCELTRLLVKAGARVVVVMTEDATRLVGPLSFQALSGNTVRVGLFDQVADGGMSHIDLAKLADALVVAPATATSLARFSCGLADNLLSAVVLASTCPLILAPAMNVHMWQNPVTQDNIRRLAALDRVRWVGPDQGQLACGEVGVGRMAEPEHVVQAIRAALSNQDLAGRNLLVSAGPTREALDPVRFVSNRSSGKMGLALTRAATRRGARVTLVHGPIALALPHGVRAVPVTSAAQMAGAIEQHLAKADALIMAAAVADFRPRQVSKQKLKKSNGAPLIDWVRTQDILLSIKKKRTRAVVVGFAAETGNPVESARQKLRTKGLQLVVANDVSAHDSGFDVDTNRVFLVDADSVEELPLMSKDDVADRVLDRLVGLLPQARPSTRRKKK